MKIIDKVCRRLGAGQRQQLIRGMRKAAGALVQRNQAIADRAGVRIAGEQIELGNNACQRRAQLMGRIGEKLLLRQRRHAYGFEQSVQCLHERSHFGWHRNLVEGGKFARRTLRDLRTERAQRTHAVAHAEPDQQ